MKNEGNDPSKLTLRVLAAIGVVMIGIAAVAAYRTSTFLDEAASVGGVVVHNVRSGNPGKYRPVVEFLTPDGETHTFTSSIGQKPPAYDVGEWVEVRYLDDDPTNARIDTFSERWVLSILLGGMGSAFISAGPLAASARRRGLHPQPDMEPNRPQDTVEPSPPTSRRQDDVEP